jgi:outer membrane protein assembly factor BamB
LPIRTSWLVLLLFNLTLADLRTRAMATETNEGQTNLLPVVILVRSPFGPFLEGKPIPIGAQASDPDGSVVEVSFFSQSNLLATLTSAPYSISITNHPVGTLKVHAVAVDNQGARATSNVRRIGVVPYPPVLTNITGDLGTGPPMIAADKSGNLLVSFRGSVLYSLTQRFGTNWIFTAADRFVSSPPVVSPSGAIYLPLDNRRETRRLLCLGPDGQSNWVANIGAHVSSSPALGRDGQIYVQTDDTVLSCVSPDGTVAWTNGISVPEFTPSRGYPSPAIGPDGTIYCTSFGGLRAVDPRGVTKWQINLGGRVFASPVIGRYGEIYLGTFEGIAKASGVVGTSRAP